MSTKDEVWEFLISRRANITPEQAGIPDRGAERRVRGCLRREVAKALRMTDVERKHLFAARSWSSTSSAASCGARA
ncbi:hypothetical protein ABZ464_20910 [Streptomyces sp. NPDC005820]|uniref:hypothetical protein n=1 Tax=Streptomyces sp. NPDC005820 TaxID=3157069 RepID=UPI0033CF22EE